MQSAPNVNIIDLISKFFTINYFNSIIFPGYDCRLYVGLIFEFLTFALLFKDA